MGLQVEQSDYDAIEHFDVISSETPLWKAWRALRKIPSGILLVSTGASILGFVSRAEIHNLPELGKIESLPITEILNTRFASVKKSFDKNKASSLFTDQSIELVIVQDDKGIVTEVWAHSSKITA